MSSGDGAAIEQVVCDVEVDAVAGDQGAGGLQVAVLHAHVASRRQDLGGLAVGQGEGFFHEPDDVTGELRHLGGGQGHAGNQVVRLGVGGGVVQQRLVLGFVISVAVEEAAAGELA